MSGVPASIRYKNPGAMWGKGNPIAKKWGASQTVGLNDGMGQGNNIAVFPSFVAGICAQIDLWRTARYHNKPFAQAIAVWSGGNWVESYIKFVLDRVPGMTRSTIMSDSFLASSQGILFLKAQAWHEAGRPYPAPQADWEEAQRKVFGSINTKIATAGGATNATTATTAVQAAQSGASWVVVFLILLLGVAITGAAVWWFKFRKRPTPELPPPPMPEMVRLALLKDEIERASNGLG